MSELAVAPVEVPAPVDTATELPLEQTPSEAPPVPMENIPVSVPSPLDSMDTGVPYDAEAVAAPPPESVSLPMEAPMQVSEPLSAPTGHDHVDDERRNHIKSLGTLGKAMMGSQIILPMEEFAEDLDLRLGRANGNIYKRRPGVDGVHDGQVMVRLKKKRFIIIDYSIVPNEQDIQTAAMYPHINVPLGGGVNKCTGKIPSSSEPGAPLVPCAKTGVPILLHDSEPDQPASLYLRSGLCFTCQRNLNEKRRTQRKRPSDRANHQANAKVSANAQQSQAAFLAANTHHQPMLQGAILPHQLGHTTNIPGMTNVLMGGIGNQANLVGAGTTGRVNATPHHRVLMAVTNGHKKIKLAHTNQPLVLAPDAIILNGPPDNHSCKSVRGGHGFAEIGTDLGMEVHTSLQSTQTLLHSVNTPEMIQMPPPTPDEISRTYEQAFYSLSKSLYLLVQWKTSWDTAIASAMQQDPHHGPRPPPQQQHTNAVALQAASMANAAATAAIGGMINGPPQLVDQAVVASAAAVAAVSQPPPNNIPHQQQHHNQQQQQHAIHHVGKDPTIAVSSSVVVPSVPKSMEPPVNASPAPLDHSVEV